MKFIIATIIVLLIIIGVLLVKINCQKHNYQIVKDLYHDLEQDKCLQINENIKNKQEEFDRLTELFNKNKLTFEQNAAILKKNFDDYSNLLIENQNKLETVTKQNIDKNIQEYYDHKLDLYNEQYEDTLQLIKTEMQEYYTTAVNNYNNQLNILKKEIDEYSIKQNAINQEIMRRRAIEEQQDFSRIILSDNDKNDIDYLLSIVSNLRNKTLLYKLIWSEYIQKAFNQMLKNVLGNTSPRNVIYMIRNIKTNEIYIGKTKSEVSKRWTEHLKTSLNIGTVAGSKIHEALYQHWDDFSWEIIERVPDAEDLSAREHYYINYYQSNIYGYNIAS